jgi:hypothetical protein
MLYPSSNTNKAENVYKTKISSKNTEKRFDKAPILYLVKFEPTNSPPGKNEQNRPNGHDNTTEYL